ncbi:MAG: hypothetical protein KDB22_13495 [Planctomycetales bacterium]|nr:hypothetical protein [Planctomycetales bacterium]
MSTNEAVRNYLQRAFSMNPVWQAANLIDLRSRAVRSQRLDAQQADVDLERVARLRQRARKQISQIQTEFWKQPLDQLLKQVDSVGVDQLPELLPTLNRLRNAARCRADFPKMAQAPWMDMQLFNAFKEAVVLPPSEAGQVKERFLSRIRSRAKLKRIQKAAAMMATEFPVLYAMEQDWFTTLKKTKLRQSSDEYSGSTFESSFDWAELSWPTWIVIMIVIRALLRLLAQSGQ